jgi:predicted transcriptional regulator
MNRIPNAITFELLVQAYYTNIDRSDLRSVSLAEAFDFLKEHELIEEADVRDEFRITAKGRFFIDHVLALPLPVEEKRWVIPCE